MPDPRWEAIRDFTRAEADRIARELPGWLKLRPGWRGSVLSMWQEYPPYIAVRIWLDADTFKKCARRQLPDAFGGNAFAACLTDEDLDAAGTLVAGLQGELRGKLARPNEYFLDYELRPQYRKMLEVAPA